jgi:hypothetical protein
MKFSRTNQLARVEGLPGILDMTADLLISWQPSRPLRMGQSFDCYGDQNMTLEAYDSDRLDALALRVLDLCGRLRQMAREFRSQDLPNVALHDRKALEWIDKLEEWMAGAEAEVSRAAKIHQGARRAAKERAARSPK